MAAAWLNELADPASVRAVSAGTQPGKAVHPEVLLAMQEVAVNLSAVRPQLLTEELARSAQLLVTMGCGEALTCEMVAIACCCWAVARLVCFSFAPKRSNF